MIRLFVRTQDCSAGANVEGAKAEQSWKSFLIDAPPLEKLLSHADSVFITHSIEGFEIVPPPAPFAAIENERGKG